MWAAANLFHVWGRYGRAINVLSNWSTVVALQALIGVVAIVVLLRPRALTPLLVLCTLGPLTTWFEAPLLGSHWVVAMFVDLALILAVVVTREPGRLEGLFLPLARWVLIIFYVFAGFAKLNHAFFTPAVSCGTYFLDELAQSLHIGVHSQSGGWWTNLVPFAVAGTELSIPILLLVRRTRHTGVMVALLFHSLIAFDQTHQFSDFSSVLAPLFVLFLPRTFASDVVGQARQLASVNRERIRAFVILGAALLLVAQFYGRGDGVARLFLDGRGFAWAIYDVALLALVIAYLLGEPRKALEHPLALRRDNAPPWLAVLPALVLFTGLSPYLELRTAYAFNMYSNLETVDGRSNHLIVTRTLPLTDVQSDLVHIVATDDLGLQEYVNEFDIPFLQLRDYLSRHSGASLTYVRHGEQHHVARASDDPALVEPVPSWEQKLFAFRSIDQHQPNRCQPGFLPAL
jgi:hypothetical protein